MAFSFLEKSKFWIISALLAGVLAVWFGAPGTVYRMYIAIERQLAGLAPQALTVGDERWVYLRSDEDQSGLPVLLLLHGFGADRDNFNPLARELKGQFNLVIPDQPGFGLSSSALDNNYEAASQARRALAFMSALGIEQFHAGGNSMGGYVALAMAEQAPERVQSLLLMAPAGVSVPPLSPVMQALLKNPESNALIPTSRPEFRQMLDLVFARPPWLPAPVVNYLADNQVARGSRLQVIFDSMLKSPPSETIAPSVATPTLVVWGDQDGVLHPAGAATLSALMPDAKAELIEGVGHLPQIEAAPAVAASYLKWIGL